MQSVAPSGNVATWNRGFTYKTTGRSGQFWYLEVYAPTGGTWFCWGRYTANTYSSAITVTSYGIVVAGSGQVGREAHDMSISVTGTVNNMMAIKIA